MGGPGSGRRKKEREPDTITAAGILEEINEILAIVMVLVRTLERISVRLQPYLTAGESMRSVVIDLDKRRERMERDGHPLQDTVGAELLEESKVKTIYEERKDHAGPKVI